ncbi:DUF2964 family protein [Paraburkholderia sp. T12-10]|nr:DUF2964 family protein [Paraburkholderia sp. T12-10]
MTQVNAYSVQSDTIEVRIHVSARRRASRNAKGDASEAAPDVANHGSVTMKSNFRIVMATVSIFLAIFGIAAAIHGLVFDEASAVKYGVAVLIGGIAAFVLLLNPASEFDDEAGQHHSP